MSKEGLNFTEGLEPACRTVDPEIFFPVGQADWRIKEAKKICEPCPVREACLNYAVEKPEQHGVWGGLSEYELRALRRQRRQSS